MPAWETPPSDALELAPDEAHLWRIPLGDDAAREAQALSLLSPDENARRKRFRMEPLRRRFAMARGGLRAVLARYVNAPARALEFDYGPQGKPALARPHNPDDVRFNLSHSHELALLGVARGRDLGVDIERLRDNVEFHKLAVRFFSPAEARSLEGFPGGELTRQFFRIWTAKEAYIKALGEGLRLPLDQFTLKVGAGQHPLLVETLHDPAERARWRFQQFEREPDYIAALALEGEADKLGFFAG